MTEHACPDCGHKDLKDLGWIRGVHVHICKGCGAAIEEISRLRVITKPTVLNALSR